MSRRLPILPGLFVAVLSGCDHAAAWLDEPEPVPPPTPATTQFDPAATSTVAGRVTWHGPLPVAPDFLFGSPRPDGTFDTRMMPNPNRPVIDPDSRAVAGAVVFLRGIDPAAAKAWDLPPVRVEWQDRQLVVRQGDRCGRAGFVRRGDAVSVVSAEPVYHVLRGRGAAFFSLTLPEPDRPRPYAFDRPGRVELSSGAGVYWARADLFVSDHPYWAVTDRDGRFHFPQVPAGPFEVVAWLPGWTTAAQDRDPESGLVTRMTYGEPIEKGRTVTVDVGRTTSTDLTVP